MILIMKVLLHNEYEIINLWYPTYVYQFLNFPYNYKNRVLACFQTRPPKPSRGQFLKTYTVCCCELSTSSVNTYTTQPDSNGTCCVLRNKSYFCAECAYWVTLLFSKVKFPILVTYYLMVATRLNS